MSHSTPQDTSSDGIDNFQLPKALVTRIAKSALPHEAKLQKDAVGALINGATVFINYLACSAQDVASSRSRKTIAAPDILKALEIIEFGDLVQLLQGELDVYRGKVSSGQEKGKDKDEMEKRASTSLDTRVELTNVALQHAGTHDENLAPGDGHQTPEDVEDIEDSHEVDDTLEAEAAEEAAEEEREEEEEMEEEEEEEPEDLVDTVAMEHEMIKVDQRGLEEYAVE